MQSADACFLPCAGKHIFLSFQPNSRSNKESFCQWIVVLMLMLKARNMFVLAPDMFHDSLESALKMFMICAEGLKSLF